MLLRRDGPRVLADVMLGIQAKEFNLGFIRTKNLVSHGLRVFRCPLANSKWTVMCLLLRSGFRLATLPWLIGGVLQRSLSLLEGSPISRGSLELCQIDHRGLVTYLTKALLHRLLRLAWRPALGRVLVVPNFFHLRMVGATVFWGPSVLQTSFGTLLQICASTQSCLGPLRTIPSTSWLGFCSDMHYQLWDVI